MKLIFEGTIDVDTLKIANRIPGAIKHMSRLSILHSSTVFSNMGKTLSRHRIKREDGHYKAGDAVLKTFTLPPVIDIHNHSAYLQTSTQTTCI